MSENSVFSTISTIGVIADTHGLLRPQAVDAFRGCELIMHAGDVGKPEVLVGLQSIVPVFPVRGNVDTELWADDLPETLDLEIGGVRIHMLHDLKQLSIDPVADGVRLIISGHTHRPALFEKAGVVYLNPGAAGPRRFKLPIALARLQIVDGRVSVDEIQFDP